MLKTTYKKSAAMNIHPRRIPKWSFPASNWKSPNAMRKMKGPNKSASSWIQGFVLKGFKIDNVLRRIWWVLIPSSSSRGSSSLKSKLPLNPPWVGGATKAGTEKEVEAGVELMSKVMKGRLGFLAGWGG